VSTGTVPALFAGLIDNAALLPPGAAPFARVVVQHRAHEAAWYGGLLGPLLVPATVVPDALRAPGLDRPPVALIGDTGIARVPAQRAALIGAGYSVGRVEAAVAKRGEDPVPGLRELLDLADPGLDLHAEIPLTWGVTEALDLLADARRDGIRATAKFRTGGLAAELYPTAADLAGLIVACRERAVPFKLTAGLHRAVRHTDPETGFVHHGFLNVLTACLAAAAGESLPSVTERLASTDAVLLIDATRPHRRQQRPLWTSFGTCDLADPIADLRAVGLL
jgi:hypothetical protein